MQYFAADVPVVAYGGKETLQKQQTAFGQTVRRAGAGGLHLFAQRGQLVRSHLVERTHIQRPLLALRMVTALTEENARAAIRVFPAEEKETSTHSKTRWIENDYL